MKPSVKSDFTKLNDFIRGLEGAGKYQVNVGIMGNKNARNDGAGSTNAEIGAKHEWGSFSDRIPKRSFLRMPIFDKQAEIEAELKAKSGKDILAGNIKKVLADLGTIAEGIIGDAFQTGGFGKWPPLAPYTIEHKIDHNPQQLVNTRQLSRAITSEVVEK